ncbi:YesL family protein [Enterocloster clostridioformis]|uniref:YesL family protein n=1 Tax=Enterocloster clostridioformis TaxID=1531 RepID=UPI002676C989|nr:YesL family protein [Enterocloster clostridioformis]
MKKIFDQDNAFNRILTRMFDLMLLNILWFLCCIPIITIGASTTALYYMTLKMCRDEEGKIAEGFFRSFCQNLKQSIPITLMLLAAVFLLIFDIHVWGSTKEEGAGLLYGSCVALMIMAAAIFSYVFPLLARFDNTVKNLIANACRLAATHLVQTILILIINGIPFTWFMISPGTFSLVFWIWFFIGTATEAYLCSCLLVKIFDRLTELKE